MGSTLWAPLDGMEVTGGWALGTPWMEWKVGGLGFEVQDGFGGSSDLEG